MRDICRPKRMCGRKDLIDVLATHLLVINFFLLFSLKIFLNWLSDLFYGHKTLNNKAVEISIRTNHNLNQKYRDRLKVETNSAQPPHTFCFTLIIIQKSTALKILREISLIHTMCPKEYQKS